jgi:glycosyltransferase involved in cell wall biosynthesis
VIQARGHTVQRERPLALAAYRNAHLGEAIVVCGCGTSLRELTNPGDHITIGVNDVGRLFDPTYLVVVNPRTQFKHDRFRYVEQSNALVLFTQLDLGRVRPPVVRFRLGPYGGMEIGADVLPHTQNSPYVAVCLAAHMGARQIGLIGVDLTDNHFFGSTGRHPLSGRLPEIDAQYGQLAHALAARGVALVNLSSISRLTSLPRVHIDSSGGWIAPVMKPSAAVGNNVTRTPRTEPMKIAIEQYSPGIVGGFLDALATSAASLGHRIVRNARGIGYDRSTLSIVWNGRGHPKRGPTLYCEHGWLPRWAYQVSPSGINADSHVASFRWNGDPLTPEDETALDRHLDSIRTQPPPGFEYMETTREAAANVPERFLLVPLQIETDTNILRHAPASLRSMQALVDLVSVASPPWPVIFKQHPADVRRGNRQLHLRLRRRQDSIWPQATGNVYQLLKSGHCAGVVTINSNVAHDAMLWNVPAVALGAGVWPAAGHTPFLTALPKDWTDLEQLAQDSHAIACRRAYALHLMKCQVSLADASDPARVAGLLSLAIGRREPTSSASTIARKPLPVINVVARNRGWVFEDLKRLFVQRGAVHVRVVASERPLHNADGWIFVRTKEAAETPDPLRTTVQVHDMFDNGRYRPGGERDCVRACRGVSLSHPQQRQILEASGVSLAGKQVLVRPLGWRSAFGPIEHRSGPFTVAWVGRPTMHDGIELKRVEWFVEAMLPLAHRMNAVLLGDRLDAAYRALRSGNVTCTYLRRRDNPIEAYPAHYHRFDCLVISSTSESGPLSLFEAMASGIPVVATRVGWAPTLVEHGKTGFLVDSVEEMRTAIEMVADERAFWHAQRATIRERVSGMTLESWIDENVKLALDVMGAGRQTNAA